MAGSIDHVLQPDGTYKWEVVDPNAKAQKTTTPKTTTKKVAKKKTTSPLSD
jgi:hypothetical protein